MLRIVTSNKFLKDLKVAKSRGLDLSLLEEVVNKLANREKLEPKYHDHALSGKYSDFRECHVKPDWLLIYSLMMKSWNYFFLETVHILICFEINIFA